MSSKKSLSQLVYVIGEQAFRSGATLTISILLARATTKEEYGIYTLLFPFIIIFLDIQNGFSSTPYVTLLSKIDRLKKSSFLGNIFIFHLLITCSFLLISFLTYIFQKEFIFFPIDTSIIVFFSIAVATWLLRDFMRQVLLAELNVKWVFIFGLISNGLTIGTIISLYVTEQLTLISTYITLSVTSIIPTIVLLLIKSKMFSFTLKNFFEDIKACSKIGKWLAGRALLGVLSGPVLLNGHLASLGRTSDVALYGVCMIPSSLLSPVSQALLSFAVPKISQVLSIGKAEVKKMVSKFSYILLIVLILFNIVVYFISDWLMILLFEGKYSPSPVLLLLFTLQMSILILAIPVNSALIAMKETKSGFIGELLAVVIVLSLGFYMVNVWGIWGLVSVLLFSRIVNRGYQMIIFKRLLRNG